MKNDEFHSPSKGKMNLKGVVEEILYFINTDKQGKYKITIGTDSEGRAKVDFVTAIVVYQIGKGGRYFWRRIYVDKIMAMRQRIYQEVTFSLSIAQELLNRLKNHLQPELLEQGMEIHIDVGPNGETKDMIKEVVGMVRGNGFNCEIKPNSYCASNVADRYV